MYETIPYLYKVLNFLRITKFRNTWVIHDINFRSEEFQMYNNCLEVAV